MHFIDQRFGVLEVAKAKSKLLQDGQGCYGEKKYVLIIFHLLVKSKNGGGGCIQLWSW